MAIVSDDAGQLKVFEHTLCWIPAERGINRLIPLNDPHRQAQSWIRQQVWNVYADLKACDCQLTLAPLCYFELAPPRYLKGGLRGRKPTTKVMVIPLE